MKENYGYETEDAVQPDEQSNLFDDELLCGECAPRVDPPRLERAGEETVVDVEDFECPVCGPLGCNDNDDLRPAKHPERGTRVLCPAHRRGYLWSKP